MTKILWIVVSIITACWGAVACWAWSTFANSPRGMAEIGQAGDAFGIVNALFSGAAFIGVVATVWMQREEMKEQNKAQERQVVALTAVARINAITTLTGEIERRIQGMAPPSGRWTESADDKLKKDLIMQMEVERIKLTQEIAKLLTILSVPNLEPKAPDA